MHCYLSIFVLIVLSSGVFTTAKPRTDIDMLHDVTSEEIENQESAENSFEAFSNKPDTQQQSDDPDIEEIASREYETVHGRILAVNMAHWEKRKQKLREQETKRSNDPNVFEEIEKDNEGKRLNGLYQGDIIEDEDLEKLLHLPLRTRTKRNAVRSRKRLWTSRVIPYKFTPDMMHIKKNFMIAIGEYHKHTCIRFVPYRPGLHKNYIYFYKTKGCASKIGKNYHKAGGQGISLGSGCNYPGTILHELLHCIGFWHEQARPDRGKYVKVNWENIQKGFDDQFTKYNWKNVDRLGQGYDYESIMHYDRTAFTKNGKPTIVAIGDEKRKFGTRNHRLSTKDIIEINALYDCQSKKLGWTKWSEFTPCYKDTCLKYRERYCYHSGNPKQCGGNVNPYGVERENKKCTKRECLASNSISGNWGNWGAWTTCSSTCDDGKQTRTRQCNNPAPSKYGQPCKGDGKETADCIVKRCHMNKDDTTFDDPSRPFGMWKNKRSKLSWIRHKGFTKTLDTGPLTDHTTGKGYYLYMESSFPAKHGDQAILTSPSLTATTEWQCLKFYYTMYGNTMGSLEVRLRVPGSRKRTIFYKKGDQGQPWHFGTATIQAKKKFTLEIVATVGKVGYSDIAIDDVYIDQGKCSCQDGFVYYASCAKWSAEGSCQSNRDWMKKHCPRSCRVCGVQVCKDSNKIQCPLWAKKGECKRNRKYMSKNCAKSCKICKVAAPPCVDKPKFRDDCPLWALKSECSMKNKKWMAANCPMSCNVCVCGDNHPGCRKWAKSGQCKSNAVYMSTNCKKSCKKC